MGDLPITMSAKLDPVNGGHYDTIVSGVVGETISLAAPAEWDMVIGPPTGETDNSNYPTLPVMEGEDGWRWIYPRVTYALNPGDEVVEEITLNAYADGMWDCVDNDDYESSGEVDMSRGEELDLPFGEVKVEGIRLTVADEHADDPDWDADGEFTGPASIEVWIKSPLGEWTFWCEARGQ
ncbi:hypothetical protein D6827_03000 [Candidatus Parcubacteria bacterium]|nr:MAG: hypothetical protein D6827_03000 [Candidatus Parcubacteria bacterium]